MKKLMKSIIITACFAISPTLFAEKIVNMHFTAEKGIGDSAGTVTITETPYGLIFTPDLHGLTPGVFGFHIHEKPSCEDAGMAAGGHLDPKHTDKHLGPYNDKGHLGDLPIFYVNANGTATLPVLAPRLHHISTITHRALMIHHDGDNYSDQPEKLGGGGGRMVCGVID